MSRTSLPFLLPSLALGLVGTTGLRAQTVISSVVTQAGTVTGTGGTTQDEIDYTFNHLSNAVTSFEANFTTYVVSGVADLAYTRRNSAPTNNNQSSVWYAGSVATGIYDGPHVEDYGRLLLGNNTYLGSDNTFSNGTAVAAGNIERLDFVYSSSLTSNASMGFAVFDRGVNDVHDAFKIALITDWDYTNNVPLAYSQLVAKTPNWLPATNVVGDFGYTLFRYNNGSDLSDSYAASEANTQGIGGVVFTLADFNVTPGTQIYGYSLFGYDVTDAGDSANLIDWTNATYYPTNTDGETGGGGIDLAAINGITFSIIPEPSTYALGGILVIGLGIAARRRARAQLAARAV